MQRKPTLTARQAAFVAEYLIDKNATQAAIRAGYSAKTASSQAERLLRNVEIKRAVEEGLAKLAGKLEITAERVQLERARLALFDPRKLFHADGRPKDIKELDDDTAAAIVGLDVLEQFEGTGENRVFVGYVKKYRLATKDPSLTALERHFGQNEKRIRYPLPKVDGLKDCMAAQAAVVAAVAAGDMLPSEGQVLSSLIEHQRRALDSHDTVQRLEAIEKHLGMKETTS